VLTIHSFARVPVENGQSRQLIKADECRGHELPGVSAGSANWIRMLVAANSTSIPLITRRGDADLCCSHQCANQGF